VRRTFDAIMDADPTVYHAMNGPTEFHVIGSMKAWTIIDRLRKLRFRLLISGRYDEATPAVVQPLWTTFLMPGGSFSKPQAICRTSKSASCA
jgi:hypothetical protein